MHSQAATRITPANIAGHYEAFADREDAAREAAEEAWADDLQAEMDRVGEDMDACDVFAEIGDFDEERLAKLMDAYRERHRSADDRAYYIWLLDTLFEEAAQAHAERVARINIQKREKEEREWH